MTGIKDDDGVYSKQIGQDIQEKQDRLENGSAFKELNKVQGHKRFKNVEKVD